MYDARRDSGDGAPENTIDTNMLNILEISEPLEIKRLPPEALRFLVREEWEVRGRRIAGFREGLPPPDSLPHRIAAGTGAVAEYTVFLDRVGYPLLFMQGEEEKNAFVELCRRNDTFVPVLLIDSWSKVKDIAKQIANILKRAIEFFKNKAKLNKRPRPRRNRRTWRCMPVGREAYC